MVFSLFKFLEINLQTSFRNLIFPPDFLHLIYLPSFFHLLFTNFLYLFHFIISFPPYTPHFLTVLYEMCCWNESVFKGVSKKNGNIEVVEMKLRESKNKSVLYIFHTSY